MCNRNDRTLTIKFSTWPKHRTRMSWPRYPGIRVIISLIMVLLLSALSHVIAITWWNARVRRGY